MTTIRHRLCQRCAVAMEHDDYSEFDYDGSSDEEMESIYGMVDHIGPAVIVEYKFDGYFRCDVCSEDDIGSGYITEPFSV